MLSIVVPGWDHGKRVRRGGEGPLVDLVLAIMQARATWLGHILREEPHRYICIERYERYTKTITTAMAHCWSIYRNTPTLTTWSRRRATGGHGTNSSGSWMTVRPRRGALNKRLFD